MFKFNFETPNLNEVNFLLRNKKSWISLLLLLLLLISIPFGIYLAKNSQIFKPRASEEARDLTQQLLKAKEQYDNPGQGVRIFSDKDPKQEALENMVSISQLRKEQLLSLAKEDPEAFLKQAKLYQQRSNFPSQVQGNIEEKVQKSGKLRVFHIDYKDFKDSEFLYQLEDNAKTYRLQFAGTKPNIPSGTQVSVEGVSLDSNIVADFKDIIKKPEGSVSILTVPEYPGAKGDQKTAVILANFQNDQSEPISKDEVRKMVFDSGSGSKSIKNFYKENSYDQVSFSGDVFGWYTIPLTNEDCLKEDKSRFSIRFEDWADAARFQAVNAGVNLSTYDRFVFVFPAEAVCEGVKGVGEVGYMPSQSWIFTSTDIGVYGHELGHNLGVYHSAATWCGNKPLDDYDKCNTAEYGDPYDIMGQANLHHFNGPHKEALKWLADSNVNIATSSGIYSISALEQKTDAPQVIKIPKQDQGDFYYLEYRNAKGFDSDFRPTMVEGATLRVWYGYDDFTHLLDLSPESPADLESFYDATFKDGQQYVDPKNGVSIKQLSHNSDSVTLQINILPAAIGSWKINTPLIEPTALSAVVSNQKYIYLIGGATPNDHQQEVYFSKANSDGSLNNWIRTSNLPVKLVDHMAIYYGEYIFVLGGDVLTENYLYASIYSAKVNDNGRLSEWKNIGKLPRALLGASAAVSSEGYIFISGGTNYPDFFQTAVYSAKINSDGTLSAWQNVADLPKKLISHSSIIANGNLYILGGSGDFEQYLAKGGQISESAVYSAKVNPDGSLGSWQAQNPLPQGLESTAVSQAGDSLVVFGGYHEEWYSGSSVDKSLLSNQVYAAAIKNNGTLDSWEKLDSYFLPKPLSNHGVIAAEGNFYMLGGFTDIFIQPTVYSLPLHYLVQTPPPEPVSTTSPVPRLERLTFGPADQGVSKCAYFPRPIKRNSDGKCFYSQTSCYDNKNYTQDFSCDLEDYYDDQGRLWFTIRGQSLSGAGLNHVTVALQQVEELVNIERGDGQSPFLIKFIQQSAAQVPPFRAECLNGVLTASWPKANDAVSYEIRGVRSVNDRPDDTIWNSIPQSEKIIGNNLTECNQNTCTFKAEEKATGSKFLPGEIYYFWYHSRNQQGQLSEAVKLSAPIACQPTAVTSSPPKFTSAICQNGKLTISWTGGGPKYRIRVAEGLSINQVLDPNIWGKTRPNEKDKAENDYEGNTISYDVGSTGQQYTIWIHSEDNGKLSDRVFYPFNLKCE